MCCIMTKLDRPIRRASRRLNTEREGEKNETDTNCMICMIQRAPVDGCRKGGIDGERELGEKKQQLVVLLFFFLLDEESDNKLNGWLNVAA